MAILHLQPDAYDNLSNALEEFNNLRVDRLNQYDEYQANKDVRGMRRLLLDSQDILATKVHLDRAFPQPELTHEQDGTVYTISEYPLGGEIIELKDHGRLYIVNGGFYQSDESLKWMQRSNAEVCIVLQVKYQVGDRSENWLYLANNVLKDDFMSEDFDVLAYAGYSLMMDGDFLDSPVYTRLNLEFYSEAHPQYRPMLETFSIVRPATKMDAIKYDNDLRRSKYKPLTTERKYPTMNLENEKLFKMVNLIG